MVMQMIFTENIDYCPLYCEENIWRLCQLNHFADKQTYALFISNPSKKCAIWQQKSATNQMYPVIWDYHVVLLVKTALLEVNSNNALEEQSNQTKNFGWRVYDLDSRLPLGVALDDYLNQSFAPPKMANTSSIEISSDFSPCFRLICGKTYAREFNSDRKHMHNIDGSWISPPPVWPPIQGDERLSLAHLIDMSGGDVLTLSKLKSTLVDLL